MLTIGYRLKKCRKDRKLSQDDVANLLQVTRANISRYELGVSLPPLDKVVVLADFFEVPLNYLVRGDEVDVIAAADMVDKELLQLFLQARDLSDFDKSAAKRLLTGLIKLSES